MMLGRRRNAVDARRAGSIEAAFRRSLRAAVGGDWATAETWLERIVEADSEDLDAYHALARLYRQQGAIGRAIRMHQNLLLRGDLGRDEKREARLELARDFDAGGFAARAAAGYEEVLDEAPRHPEALARRIALCQELKEFERGLALVRRWRRVDRDAATRAEVELLLAQARAKAGEGDADAARAALKRCLRRDRECAEAWAELGELEAEKGRDGRAIDAWTRAVQAEPGLGEALLPRIAAGYAARGRPADYERLLQREMERRPGESAFPLALARALKARGQSAEAIECLSRAIASSPSAPTLRVELGRQLLEAGLESEALKAYGSLLDAIDHGGLAPAAKDPQPATESKAEGAMA
jgi:lipopolysaccharide biosynthesis regulator YciM